MIKYDLYVFSENITIMDYWSLEKSEDQIRTKAMVYALIINGLLIAGFLYFGGVFENKTTQNVRIESAGKLESTKVITAVKKSRA